MCRKILTNEADCSFPFYPRTLTKDRIYQNSQQHCRDSEYMAVIAKTIVELQGLYCMLFISQKKKKKSKKKVEMPCFLYAGCSTWSR